MNIRKRNYSTGWCVTLFISCFCLLMFATISRILRVYADLLTSFVIRSYSATSKHERKLLRTPSSKETQCKPCAHWNDHNSQEFKEILRNQNSWIAAQTAKDFTTILRSSKFSEEFLRILWQERNDTLRAAYTIKAEVIPAFYCENLCGSKVIGEPPSFTKSYLEPTVWIDSFLSKSSKWDSFEPISFKKSFKQRGSYSVSEGLKGGSKEMGLTREEGIIHKWTLSACRFLFHFGGTAPKGGLKEMNSLKRMDSFTSQMKDSFLALSFKILRNQHAILALNTPIRKIKLTCKHV